MVTDDRAIWLARYVLPHEPALRVLIRRWRLPQDLDADDIVQECYGRLAGMETVANIREPRSYLFQIARTTILMHLRRSQIVSIRAIEDLDGISIEADEPSPEQQVSDREQLHRLALGIAGLPEPGRRAFLLRMVDELSHKEIGAKLNMSDNAVQKSIAKSLGLLGRLLGRGGKGLAEASSSVRRTRNAKANDAKRDERHD